MACSWCGHWPQAGLVPKDVLQGMLKLPNHSVRVSDVWVSSWSHRAVVHGFIWKSSPWANPWLEKWEVQMCFWDRLSNYMWEFIFQLHAFWFCFRWSLWECFTSKIFSLEFWQTQTGTKSTNQTPCSVEVTNGGVQLWQSQPLTSALSILSSDKDFLNFALHLLLSVEWGNSLTCLSTATGGSGKKVKGKEGELKKVTVYPHCSSVACVAGLVTQQGKERHRNLHKI